MQAMENDSLLRMIVSSTRYKMFNFMVSILLLLIISAVLEGSEYDYLVLNTLSTIVFISGVYAAGRSKKNVIILILLGLPWFLSEWVFTKSPETFFVSVMFFLFVTAIIFENILKTRKVTTDTLYGAVCVYLLLGLLWTSVYRFLEFVSPGTVFATNNVPMQGTLTVNEIIYYSYTTLTTLGYGDITSLTPVGKIFSVLEAVVGQLFIAFLVARLVGIYTANTIRPDTASEADTE